jgi:hypothetical protein
MQRYRVEITRGLDDRRDARTPGAASYQSWRPERHWMALPPLLTCTPALTAFSRCVAAGSASIGFEAAAAPQRTWLAAVLLACPLVGSACCARPGGRACAGRPDVRGLTATGSQMRPVALRSAWSAQLSSSNVFVVKRQGGLQDCHGSRGRALVPRPFPLRLAFTALGRPWRPVGMNRA